MGDIIDGAEIARQVRSEVAVEVENFQNDIGVTPGLAVVLVGDDPASQVYVRNKERSCQEAGIFTETFRLPRETDQKDVLNLVQELNNDVRYHGILVQTPLPEQINEELVMRSLDPSKDVDCLHPYNQGLLAIGEPRFVPATPLGGQELLLRSGYDCSGKNVVICGRSSLVGKPLALLLLRKAQGANATVTVCHTGTKDLKSVTQRADILVAAMGRARAIGADMVKRGAVVVDVGINRMDDPTRKQGYRLVGDIDFDNVIDKAAAVTPVPGGVGPMTVAMLVHNTLRAARLINSP